MTLQLSAQIESSLIAEANRRGMTPDALASELILSQLPVAAVSETHTTRPSSEAEESQGTMLDKWRAHLDSLPPPSDEPRPEWLRADNVSEAVGKILEERRRQGRL
jgi:hypothetical protein